MESKDVLRKKVRMEIEALPEEYIERSNDGIYKNLISLREFDEAETVFMYYSVGREPDTVRVAEYALKKGKRLAMPYCYCGGIMQARAVTSLTELVPAMLGIPAPVESAPVIESAELDFVVVPALAFDRSGYRLGYGGGYYDRYLEGIRAFKAGVARERLLRETLPREQHDIAADCIITEHGRIKKSTDMQ